MNNAYFGFRDEQRVRCQKLAQIRELRVSCVLHIIQQY